MSEQARRKPPFRAEHVGVYCGPPNWLQIDDVPQAIFCDPSIREQTSALGKDPDHLTGKYIAAVHRIVAARPATMTIGMHLCRGNFHSRSLAADGYEAGAERLFNECTVDGFFLEYPAMRFRKYCLRQSPDRGRSAKEA